MNMLEGHKTASIKGNSTELFPALDQKLFFGLQSSTAKGRPKVNSGALLLQAVSAFREVSLDPLGLSLARI